MISLNSKLAPINWAFICIQLRLIPGSEVLPGTTAYVRMGAYEPDLFHLLLGVGIRVSRGAFVIRAVFVGGNGMVSVFYDSVQFRTVEAEVLLI